jgi:hypothetical protein
VVPFGNPVRVWAVAGEPITKGVWATPPMYGVTV